MNVQVEVSGHHNRGLDGTQAVSRWKSREKPTTNLLGSTGLHFGVQNASIGDSMGHLSADSQIPRKRTTCLKTYESSDGSWETFECFINQLEGKTGLGLLNQSPVAPVPSNGTSVQGDLTWNVMPVSWQMSALHGEEPTVAIIVRNLEHIWTRRLGILGNRNGKRSCEFP